MFDHGFRPVCAATAIALILTTPAWAQQISAKTAWEDLRGAAQENGVVIASAGITDYGTSLVASDVRVQSVDNPDFGTLTMDELRIEPRGEHVALIPSPQMTLTARFAGSVERVFQIDHQGEILYRVTDDEMDFSLDFERLGVEMIRSQRRGIAQDEAFSLDFGGLDSSLHLEREGNLAFVLDAATVGYAFVFDQQSGGTAIRNDGSATIEAIHMTVDAAELDALDDGDAVFARAFDAGFSARMALTSGRTVGDSVQRINGQEIRFHQVAAGSDMAIELVDGGFSMITTAGGGVLQAAMGPMQGEVSLDGAAFELSFPLVASDEDRSIRFGMSLDRLTPTPETLAMLGAQDFAGDSISMALRVGADGRLTEDLSEDFGSGDEPPFDLSSVRLEELAVTVGDAQLTGSGAFVFLGGLLASWESDMPNGTGDFVMDLIGGDALLMRLGAAGLIPQDQQFFARMMMNSVGRPVGDDHLRSEIEIRPGGSVTVNGAPLPF